MEPQKFNSKQIYNAMTTIEAYDSRGKRVYHYSTPRNLTPEEIEQDLKDMCVDRATHKVVINGK